MKKEILKKEVIVISLGGSVIIPKEINLNFLRAFTKLIRSKIKTYNFIIVTGGGSIARIYMDSASKIARISPNERDWIGIAALYLNAQLLKSLLHGISYSEIITNPTNRTKTKKPVIIAAGWKPGWSTDYDAVQLAKAHNASKIINITNVDYLYDSNPHKNRNAKKLLSVSWQHLQKIVGTRWKPGLNAPFDPIATKLASKSKIKLIIAGQNISNLKKILEKKPFKGSVVQ